MTFVLVAAGAAAQPPRKCWRAAALLGVGLLCGAATFGTTLAVMWFVHQQSDAASSGGGHDAVVLLDSWWWLVAGASALALSVVASLFRALLHRVSWAHRRLVYETDQQPTVAALRRLPPHRGARPKIFPETTPREQEEPQFYESEQPPLTEGAPATARVVLTSLARLLMLLSAANLGSGLVLLGWMYNWVWIPACETELGWVIPSLDCRWAADASESSSGSGSIGDSVPDDSTHPSDWIASSIDLLSLALLQVFMATISVCCNATLLACLVDGLALAWIVTKVCIFVAVIAEENAAGLVMVTVAETAPDSSSTGVEDIVVVWAPHRAALLSVALLATCTQLMLLLKMRGVSKSLSGWHAGIRRYRARQGWSPARAGWSINGDLEFMAGDVLLINHEDTMYEDADAREFELQPFRYAELEGRPRHCRCCLTQYRTQGGAVPMRLLEVILADGEVKRDRTLEKVTAAILAEATEKAVDQMCETSSFRPTQIVKSHPAARPHSAQSSVAESSEYGTDRSNSSRATGPIAAPSQRLAVRRALSTVMRDAEREEVNRATIDTATESDTLRGGDTHAADVGAAVSHYTRDDETKDRRGMAAALALEAKARPFGTGELPGLAQHSIAVSASEIAGRSAQPFSRVMDTSQTLTTRFGPGLDNPFARPQSASARISSAGVTAVSVQGLKEEIQSGGSSKMPTVSRGALRSVRHRPTSASRSRPGSGRPSSARSSRPGSGTRRPLSAGESVKALRLFDALIADSDPVPLPGWTQHKDEAGELYWYCASDGVVTYAEPVPPHYWMPGRRRLRRENQALGSQSSGTSRPYSAAARHVATEPTDSNARPRSAAARLQNSPWDSRSHSDRIHPSSSSTVISEEEGDDSVLQRQRKLEQMLMTVELQADHAAQVAYADDEAFVDGDNVSEMSDASADAEGLEAVSGIVEDGKGWQIPADPPLREHWGAPAGGGAGPERPQDVAAILRDVSQCRGAVTKATFDARWPGDRSEEADDRIVSHQDRYEYQDAPGGNMFLAKSPPTLDDRGGKVDGDEDAVLDIAVAQWLSSIGMGHHSLVLASLGTSFKDFEGLTAGDLFAAGVEEPGEISVILTRLRGLVPPIRVVPRPRTASPGSRGAARPGSAKSVVPSFAETVSVKLEKQSPPDPGIVSALVAQGIAPSAARRAAVETDNAGIEAAMRTCLMSKRPRAVRVPVDGLLEVVCSRITGVEQAKKHDTVRMRVGLHMQPDVTDVRTGQLQQQQQQPVTWSKAAPVMEGVATYQAVKPAVLMPLSADREPILVCDLAWCRKTGNRAVGSRQIELSRSLGPRWTPEVHLKQRFRVHHSEWGENLAVELTLIYHPKSQSA